MGRGPQITHSTNSTAAKLFTAAGARARQVNTYGCNRNVLGKIQESFDIFAAVNHNGLKATSSCAYSAMSASDAAYIGNFVGCDSWCDNLNAAHSGMPYGDGMERTSRHMSGHYPHC